MKQHFFWRGGADPIYDTLYNHSGQNIFTENCKKLEIQPGTTNALEDEENKQNNLHTIVKLEWYIRAVCHKSNYVSSLIVKGKKIISQHSELDFHFLTVAVTQFWLI